MSAIGRWEAVYDEAEEPLGDDPKSLTSFLGCREPGWRIAWCFGTKRAWYGDMTFGRAEDAARAIEALYTLNDWDCVSLEESRAVMMQITKERMNQTILEAMAW